MITDTRPPKPETPGSGLEYLAVPAEGWRLARGGSTCRWHAPSMGITACGEPAVAEKHYPDDLISPWWAYCAEHARTYGRPDAPLRGVWAEGGKVLKWGLCHTDGTLATAQEVARARAKHARESVKDAEPSPGARRPLNFRERGDTIQDVGQAAEVARTSASRWITEAIAARLGYARCLRCDARVPLAFGGLSASALGKPLAEAVKRAERQHPGHEPVRVGGEPAHPAAIPFREPAVKP
jgi:hypothetical protein